jgi:hypothetical protein
MADEKRQRFDAIRAVGEDRALTRTQFISSYGDVDAPKLWCWSIHDRDFEPQQLPWSSAG